MTDASRDITQPDPRATDVAARAASAVPAWSVVALALPVWISTVVVTTLTRGWGVTLGAGEGGAANAVVLRLLVGAAAAIPIALIAGRRGRWTALAVTAAAWSLATIGSAAVVPEPAGFTMAWALAGVPDAMGFIATALLLGVSSGQRRSNGATGLTVSVLFTSLGLGSAIIAAGGPWLSLSWRGVLVAMIGLTLPGAFAAATIRMEIDVRVLDEARRRPALSLGELCAATMASAARRRGLFLVGLMGAVLFSWVSFGPSLLRTRWALDTAASALVISGGFFAAGLCAFVGPLRLNAAVQRSASLLGLVLFVGALALPGPTPVFVIGIVAAMGGLGLGIASAFGDAVSGADEATKPIALALGFVVFAAGGAAGVLAASTIDRRFGVAISLTVCALPALIAAVIRTALPHPPVTAEPAFLTPVEESTGQPRSSAPLIELRNVDVFYGSIQVLFGVNLSIRHDEIVALLGTNGAGKSTALKVIAGQVLPRSGAVLLEGTNITSLSAERRVHLGLAQIPGGRAVFGSLTVVENLELFAASLGADRSAVKRGIERTFATFPRLEAHRNRDAQTLSGGEQQMLALGKALLLEPRLLCIDELSLGLAPAVVADLLDLVRTIHANGTTIVIVEQSVNVALSIAQRAVFMEKGEVRFDGDAAELRDRSDLLRSVFLHGAAT